MRHEHERWDGTGYPDGIRGEAIPLPTRIVLACDTFNALVSARPYRPALAVEAAAAELRRCAGTRLVASLRMEPNDALAELKSLSSQIEDVAILGQSGFVLASTGTPERGEQLARAAAELLAAAADVRPSGEVVRLEVALGTGSVFVVCEGGRRAVATTVAEPTAGLVVYDLRTALGRLDEKPAAPTRVAKPRKKRSPDA